MGEFVIWAMRNTLPILGGFILVAIVMTVFLLKLEKRKAEATIQEGKPAFSEYGRRLEVEERPMPGQVKEDLSVKLEYDGVHRKPVIPSVKGRKWRSGVADKWESDDHRALLVMCMGDASKAERLIEFERGKTPSGNRASWIKEAIARWGRDLHRL